jgi:hypothetical protein
MRALALRSRARGRPMPNTFSRWRAMGLRRAVSGFPGSLASIPCWGARRAWIASAAACASSSVSWPATRAAQMAFSSSSWRSSIASPFGIKSRRRARTISGKAPLQPKMAIASDHDFGDMRVAETSHFPGLPGHRPAFIGGFRVSGLRQLHWRTTRRTVGGKLIWPILTSRAQTPGRKLVSVMANPG